MRDSDRRFEAPAPLALAALALCARLAVGCDKPKPVAYAHPGATALAASDASASPAAALLAGSANACLGDEAFRNVAYANLWKPVIADTCMGCHQTGGIAASTRLDLAPVDAGAAAPWNSDAFVANLTLLSGLAAAVQAPSFDSVLVLKPSLQIPHGGGQNLDPKGTGLATMKLFVARLNAGEGHCLDHGLLGEGGADPLEEWADMPPGRTLRRLSLATGNGLPSLDDHEALLAGTKTYTDFTQELLTGKSSANFVTRLMDTYMKQVSNHFLTNLVSLDDNIMGRGTAWRPRHLKSLAGGYEPLCAAADAWDDGGVTDNRFRNGNVLPAQPYSECVLEAPAKAIQVAIRRAFLQPGDPNQLMWFTNDWGQQGFQLMRPEFTHINNAVGYLQPFNTLNQIDNQWFGLNDGGQFIGLVFSSISALFPVLIPEVSPQYLPGYYSGCLLPGETAPTTVQMQAWAAAAPPSLLVDTARLPIQPGALRAVTVHPWWAPDQTVYACPGLAVQEAVDQGVLPALPPNYRRNPQNNNASEFYAHNNLPATIGGQPTVSYIETYTADPEYWERPSAINAALALMGSERWHQCTASAFNTEMNPECDCGANLMYCNPLHNLTSISATFEGHALLKHVLDNRLPMADFVTGKYRMSTRALEWLYFQTRDKAAADRAGAHWDTMRYLAVDELPRPGIWLTKGTWPTESFAAALDGMPSMPNLAWDMVGNNPTMLNNGQPGSEVPNGVLNLYTVRSGDPGFPMSGFLTTATLLHQHPTDRNRANFLFQLFQCTALASPSAGTATIAAAEIGLEPRQQVLSGCAKCHINVDGASHMFHNFGGSDPLNTNFASIPAVLAGGYQADLGTSGRYYLPEAEITARFPHYYGQAPGGAVDAFMGVTADKGVPGYAGILTGEPGFTQCSTLQLWQVLLGRPPDLHELHTFRQIVGRFQGKSYSFQDLAQAIVASKAFGKAP